MYTWAKTSGNNILVTEVDDNYKLTFNKYPFNPELFALSTDDNDFVTYLENNKPLKRIVFDSVKDFTEYRYQSKNIENSGIYNDIDAHYQFIFKNYDNKNIPKLRIWKLDIEAGENEQGQVNADSENADCPISLIQILERDTKIVYLFGYQYDFKPDENKLVQELIAKGDCSKVYYFYCENEYELLDKFVKLTYTRTPAIITAYNGSVYDFPMIFKRLDINGFQKNILSPFGTSTKTKADNFGKEFEYELPDGFVWIDYLELYKKIILFGKTKDSWKLEFTTEDVLGDSGKLDYTVLGFKDIVSLIKYDYNPKLDLEENSIRKKLYYDMINNPDDIHKKEQFRKEIYDNVFVYYGILDVTSMNKLEDKLGAIDIIINVSYEMGVNFIDTLSTVRPWTVYLYRYLYGMKMALPSKPMYKKKPFGGGHQYAVPGLYEWLGVADYSSLYTSIQIETNISPETYIAPEDTPPELWELIKDIYYTEKNSEDVYINKSEEEKAEINRLLKKYNLHLGMNGNCYDISKQGLIPAYLEEMYWLRKKIQKEAHNIEVEMNKLDKNSQEYKDLEIEYSNLNGKQLVYKTLLNAYYGCQGEKGFVLYNPDNAGSVTAYGRFSIKTTTKYVDNYLNKLLGTDISNIAYIHTDSGYINFNGIVKAFNKNNDKSKDEIATFLDKFVEAKVIPVIDESTNKNKEIVNAFKSFMKMDIEAILDKAIITGKSRMAVRTVVKDGIILNKDKIKVKITGLQIKRADTPKLCRKQLENCIKIIFDKNNNELIDYIKKVEEEIKTVNPFEIGVPIGIGEMEKYEKDPKGITQQARGSFVYNKLIETKKLNFEKIYKGDKVKVLFLKKNPIVSSEVISVKDEEFLQETGLDKFIDYNAQINRIFTSALENLTNAIGWETKKSGTIKKLF